MDSAFIPDIISIDRLFVGHCDHDFSSVRLRMFKILEIQYL